MHQMLLHHASGVKAGPQRKCRMMQRDPTPGSQ